MYNGFLQGNSDNLLKIDYRSVFYFLSNNPNFCGAEMRNMKTSRSTRENYGDHADGLFPDHFEFPGISPFARSVETLNNLSVNYCPTSLQYR
ncbi:hypothetical protein JTB14_014710 [Gonioctena quinquepunctata]|nr:hypothetical protein JTB14_014710 [Gonioctena quinquepunctata]